MVPVGFREKVLRLAHKTLLTEHLGIKKTLDRVVSEFFWPGVCGDVATVQDKGFFTSPLAPGW